MIYPGWYRSPVGTGGSTKVARPVGKPTQALTSEEERVLRNHLSALNVDPVHRVRRRCLEELLETGDIFDVERVTVDEHISRRDRSSR